MFEIRPRIRSRRWLRIVLVAMLFLLAAGLLYDGHPFPWTYATEEADNISRFRGFSILAEIIRDARQESGSDGEMSIHRALAEAGVTLEGNKVTFFSGEMEVPVILDNPRSSADIAIIGQEKDCNGMVWAVTHEGEILKILP